MELWICALLKGENTHHTSTSSSVALGLVNFSFRRAYKHLATSQVLLILHLERKF